MTIHAYTSFSFSYLNRARVLAATLRQHHPDWTLWAVVTDAAPDTMPMDWTSEGFDRVIFSNDLMGKDADAWLFGHNIVEACTAVKGAAAAHILAENDCKKLLYFDPDIAIFNPMDDVVAALETHSIVLTPHQTAPAERDNRQSILDNEISSLMHGAYNLGFIAMANTEEGRRFAGWWDDRLRDWCQDRKEIGVFVDQKWCDLIPCFFDDVKILRDPGYNVASWNLSHRTLTFDPEGLALVNGRPLRFFHFTKLGAVGDTMTKRYAGDNFEVFELWAWYKSQVEAETDPNIPAGYWRYGTFDNGVPIPDEARRLYRERVDLRKAFPNPIAVDDGYFGWLKAETDILTTEGPHD